MFNKVKLLREEFDNNYNYTEAIYLVEDTEFMQEISLTVDNNIYANRGKSSIIPSGIIATYSQLNKNVPINLALFYIKSGVTCNNKYSYYLKLDCEWTDAYFPNLEYGKKYYKCMLNQLKTIEYTGKFNRA